MNEGERAIQGVNEEGIQAAMTFQIGDVSGPLGSVRRMAMAGNTVVFDSEGSYIIHKATGAMTTIHDEEGKYVLKMWVQKKGMGEDRADPRAARGEGKKNETNNVRGGRFNALMEESDEQGFVGLGENWV